MDKRNLLLAKEVDEKNHKTTYKRHFETTGPNEKWTTDVSEFNFDNIFESIDNITLLYP